MQRVAASLKSFIDGPHEQLKDTIRQYFANTDLYRANIDELPLDQQRELTKQRVVQYMRYLGTIVDLADSLNQLERSYQISDVVGTCCDESFKVKTGVQAFLFAGSLALLGEEHHKPYMDAARQATMLGCFGMTETDHGSNVRLIETEAVFDKARDAFVLRTPHSGASKRYIGNAGQHGTHAVVFARLVIDGRDEGPHAFLVRIRNDDMTPCAGVVIEDMGPKAGLNGVDNGVLTFNSVVVPRSMMLSKYAQLGPDGAYKSPFKDASTRFFATLSAMNPTRLALVAGSLGALKRGLYIAVRYAHDRRQFGVTGQPEQRIIDYQSHQWRLMPPLAIAFALDVSKLKAARLFQLHIGEVADQDMVALCSGLKYYSTGVTAATLQACRECCGGQGFMTVNLLGGMRASQDIHVTFDGDNVVLRQQVAKDLLDDLKTQMTRGGKFSGLLSFLGTRVQNMLKENVPSLLHMLDEDRLLNSSWQIDVLQYFEGKILQTLALRLRSKITGGMHPFSAWNNCLDQVCLLADSHMHRLLLENFVEAINKCADPVARTHLERLCNLFAVHVIYENRAWFLEQGYFAKPDVKVIRRTHMNLCREVAEWSLEYVDAFAIPKACIPAPIAHGVFTQITASRARL